jgi:putative phosphoesterase
MTECKSKRSATRIGIISDTHGLLRPEAVAALQGAALILHAGDIGDPGIIEALEEIAPVIAVRGNNDRDAWARTHAEREVVTVDEVQIYLLHDLKEMTVDPVRAGHRVVVSGHSHKPSVEERNGVLYVNPGSAGPRRFSLPVSVACMDIEGNRVSANIVTLDVPKKIKRGKQ